MTTRILSIVTFFALLILTGFSVWNLYVAQLRAQDSMRSRSMIPSAQSTTELSALVSNYTSLIILHVTDLYDGKETLSSKEQLDTTIQKMGDALAVIGAKEQREEFIKIFQNHVEGYENYTVGLKAKNQQKMDAAKNTLATDAHNLGKLFGGGEDLMNQHSAIILAIIDAHAQNNNEKKLLLIKDAGLQASVFADELVAINEQKEHL